MTLWQKRWKTAGFYNGPGVRYEITAQFRQSLLRKWAVLFPYELRLPQSLRSFAMTEAARRVAASSRLSSIGMGMVALIKEFCGPQAPLEATTRD